jgi:hypothetical protein
VLNPAGTPVGVTGLHAPDAVVQKSILTDLIAVAAAGVKLNVYVVLAPLAAELETVTFRAVNWAALTELNGTPATSNAKIAMPDINRFLKEWNDVCFFTATTAM